MSDQPYSHPILSCEQSLRFEKMLLGTEAEEWAAMQAAGRALASAMLADWHEAGGTQWRWAGLYGGADTQAGTGIGICTATAAVSTDSGTSAAASVGDAGGICAATAGSATAGIGPRMLVLVGKGHNGGDALLAALEVARRFETVQIVVSRTSELEALRPLCRRAWDALLALAAAREGVSLLDVSTHAPETLFSGAQAPYVFCIDGLLGMQSRPPLRGREAAVLAVVNAAGNRIGLRAAVDLPSGLGDPAAFRADFTYATGIAKSPAFKSANSLFVGRLRYLDIGFFTQERTAAALSAAFSEGGDDVAAKESRERIADSVPHVLTPAVLDAFRGLRSPFGDKRHYGHLFVLAGSAQMPGALLMNVQSALRSGAGLVTAFAPESVAHIFAAQAPEAMWIPWPETDEGTLALEGQYLLATHLQRATALLMGSGMGRSAETLALLEDIARTTDVPLVIDADALQPSVLAAATRHPNHGQGRAVIITPHAGEFMRLCAEAPAPLKLPPSAADFAAMHTAGTAPENTVDMNDFDWAGSLRAFCRQQGVVTVLKGVQTRVATATELTYGLFGGPVLARGGSGDVLAGLVGGCLVQRPQQPFFAAEQAVCWHGLASQLLARERGAVSVTTMNLVRHLPAVIRGE